MENKKKIYIGIVIVIFAIICIVAGVVLMFLNENANENVDDSLDTQTIYVDVSLPSILGSENISLDEFSKKTNTSQLLKEDKEWMNLTFTNFDVYSVEDSTSVIEFDIVNNSKYLIESSKFQFQLLGEDLQILSLINFDEVVMPIGSTRHVKVNVTDGDITNLKDIKVDDINYEMKVGG